MSYQIQPHQIILAGMATCSTEGANSYFNSLQEHMHSHPTHFEDALLRKGHLLAKERHKAFGAFSTHACPSHFYTQTSCFMKTKVWSSDEYLLTTHLIKMLVLLLEQLTHEKRRRNKSQELLNRRVRKARTHEITVAPSKCLVWMSILALKRTYNINHSNYLKHACFKLANKQNPSKTTLNPIQCWNSWVYIPKESFLSDRSCITFSQVNK